MKTYTIEGGGRKIVPLYIAAASIGSTWLVTYLLSISSIVLPWWIEGPSVLGFYGLFYSVFDEKLWKTSLIRRALKIPDLNGMWIGHIESSYDNFQESVRAELKIKQTWTRMSIIMKTQTSKGCNLTGAIFTDLGEVTLSFEFLNEPNVEAPSPLHIHRGTTRLVIDSAVNSLDGEYYTGRDRGTAGLLHFDRTTGQI